MARAALNEQTSNRKRKGTFYTKVIATENEVEKSLVGGRDWIRVRCSEHTKQKEKGEQSLTNTYMVMRIE